MTVHWHVLRIQIALLSAIWQAHTILPAILSLFVFGLTTQILSSTIPHHLGLTQHNIMVVTFCQTTSRILETRPMARPVQQHQHLLQLLHVPWQRRRLIVARCGPPAGRYQIIWSSARPTSRAMQLWNLARLTAITTVLRNALQMRIVQALAITSVGPG